MLPALHGLSIPDFEVSPQAFQMEDSQLKVDWVQVGSESLGLEVAPPVLSASAVLIMSGAGSPAQ